jgi:hypothetical protein
MRNLVSIAAILTLGLAACVHNDNPVTVRTSVSADSDNPRAREAGLAAGAGGSHAPGSTGLGAGTMGIGGSGRIGSAR